jgi:hypothetical protein
MFRRTALVRKNLVRQTTRKALTVTAMAAVVTGGAFLTGGTASAGTMLADNCTSPVSGNMGDQIAITGASVKELVRKGANEAGTLAVGDWAANDIAKVPTIVIGAIPATVGITISGESIGSAVRKAVDSTGTWGLGLDKKKTLDNIALKVAGSCQVTGMASNYVAPTTPRSDNPANGGDNGQAGGSLAPATPGGQLIPNLGTGSLSAPQRDYSNIPAATPGGFAVPPGIKYPAGSPLPGQQSPEFGVLGAGNAQPGQSADVRNAGNADSLAAPASADDVQLPMLLAVLALAGVTAALVRTWVLRNVS